MVTVPQKKVLIFTEHFAPAYKAGGIVRSLENLVRGFDGKFSFKVVTSNNSLCKNEVLKDVQPDQWIDFTATCQIIYLSASNRKFGVIRQIIDEEQPDIIYINGMFSPVFTICPLLFKKLVRCPSIIVLAPRGMLHKGNLKIKRIKKHLYLFLFKIARLPDRVRWHATDKQEQEDIRHLFGKKANVTIASPLPNNTITTTGPITKVSGQLKLVTISLITRKKGHLELLRLLKEAQKTISVELNIYGPIRDQKVWKLCEQEIKGLGERIKVVYHGFIPPEKVVDSLKEGHFFILLSGGENFCHAAFDALKNGRPLIISDQMPWKGLAESKAGWDIPLADKQQLLSVLQTAYEMNQSTYNSYCHGAQLFASNFLKETSFENQYGGLFT